MNTLKNKAVMAKNSSFPGVLIEMAKLTLRGEYGGLVIWLLCLPVIFIMAFKACHFRRVETLLAVAVRTVQGPVHPLQRIPGCRSMVPLVGGHILPRVRRMAVAAMDAQSQLISVILSALPMAGFTFPRSSFENQAKMAFPTGGDSVFTNKREIGIVMGFHSPLLRILLLLTAPMHPSEDPYYGQSYDHGQNLVASHFRSITLIKNRCWSDFSWTKYSY
jgi:hypothetical protein